MNVDQPATEQLADPCWPQFDPDVMNRYGGKWVVAFDGRIVAASDDPADARRQAAKLLGTAPDQLTAVAISAPDAFFV